MPHPSKIFRRNTSGIIGLRKEAEAAASGSADQEIPSKPLLVHSNSSNISTDILQIRETAARRISAHEPPVLDELTKPETTLTIEPASKPKVRKTSEIVRPNFSIYEERESKGMFVSGILNERSDAGGPGTVTFSFLPSRREDSDHDLELLDDFSSIDLNDDSDDMDGRMSPEEGNNVQNQLATGTGPSGGAPKFSFMGRFDLYGRRDSSDDMMHSFPQF